jgi:hypothetical protein
VVVVWVFGVGGVDEGEGALEVGGHGVGLLRAIRDGAGRGSSLSEERELRILAVCLLRKDRC